LEYQWFYFHERCILQEKNPLNNIPFFKNSAFTSILIQRFNVRVNSWFNEWSLKCQNVFTRCVFLLKINSSRKTLSLLNQWNTIGSCEFWPCLAFDCFLLSRLW
jgi:hypothetical protein